MKNFPVRPFAGIALSSGLFLAACAVQAQTQTMPDAQIESNVLRALAGAPELSTQNIQTTTVYGTVTITGNVATDADRTKAENLVARALGVKKVVDELALGDAPATSDPNAPQTAGMAPGEMGAPPQDAGGPPQDAQGQNLVLQSDGTYAPAPPPDAGQDGMAAPQQQAQNDQAPPPGYNNEAPPQGYGAQGPPQGYGNQAPPQGYGDPSQQGRQPMYQNGPPQGYAPQGGQRGGIPVVVPAGAMLRIRINRGIDSQHIKPGTPFDGVVLSDVPADGTIAIPRGATVTGVVAAAEKTKALSGQGGLSLQITGISLGGQVFPVQSDTWQRTGADKTTSTVNHAVGLGVLGAVVGAVAGGGAGAAIGAGVGAGAGVAASAGSPRGQVIVPPESVLVFHLAAPAPVRTVSEQEMARLSYAAGPVQPAPRRYARPGYYPYPGAY